MRLVLAVIALLVFAPSAYAQGATVRGFDDGGGTGHWEDATVKVKAGETVDWVSASGTHDVESTSTNWNVPRTTIIPYSHTFPATGTYTYRYNFHMDMNGTVEVSDESGTPPPPPPPPPPSEQRFPNDQQPPTVFELVDEVRPELTGVGVEAVRNGARVRFRLSERARVHVRFKRGGLAVKTIRKSFGAGPGRLTVRDRRMNGRYRVEVFARDLSGNRSGIERESVTVR